MISPNSRKTDRKLKPSVYLRSGVQHVWLLDPITRELEVLRAQGGAWILVDSFYGDDLVRVAHFAAYELDLLVLWGEERVIEA
jgi:Uma2 family endonuclease